MENKLFSVLTPTHNRAKNFLPKLIQSVMNQKEDGFSHEHIIVDNLSTDATEKIVREFAKKDKRIKYIKNSRNLGAADALNVAFKKSKGDFIIQADDDDLLPQSSLKHRFAYYKEHPKAKWTYSDLLFIDTEDRLYNGGWEYRTTYIKHKTMLLSLLARNFIPGGTATFKRECIKKAGGWNVELKTQDYDMSLKLAHAGFIPEKINSYLYFYRVHPAQSSKKQKKDETYARERQYYLDLYGVKESILTKN
jgi:alpha-1,6-rhamnosyltransferase